MLVWELEVLTLCLLGVLRKPFTLSGLCFPHLQVMVMELCGLFNLKFSESRKKPMLPGEMKNEGSPSLP
jgi:hypothetical protein